MIMHFNPPQITVGNVADMFGNKELIIDTVLDFAPQGGIQGPRTPPKSPMSRLKFSPILGTTSMSGKVADTSKPKMVLICDSFGHNIFPYLAEQFRKEASRFLTLGSTCSTLTSLPTRSPTS
jgi:hypothetical protein